LALFSLVALLVGTAGYILFLLKLQFPTEPWYYMGVLTLGAICLEAMLTANWRELRPWGLLRTGFAVLFLVCGAKSMWHEAHTRRSNVDLIATVLGRGAGQGDLIVVQGAWEGLTFDRYYQGRASWVTVPPLDSHKVHRNDLMWEKMNQPDPMAPVLTNISTALKNGKTVWVVGHLIPARPGPPAQPSGRRWLGEYMGNWGAQLTAHLSTQAREMKRIEIPLQGPVSAFENLPLLRFSGYQTASDSNGGPEEKRSPRGTRDNSHRSLLAFNY